MDISRGLSGNPRRVDRRLRAAGTGWLLPPRDAFPSNIFTKPPAFPNRSQRKAAGSGVAQGLRLTTREAARLALGSAGSSRKALVRDCGSSLELGSTPWMSHFNALVPGNFTQDVGLTDINMRSNYILGKINNQVSWIAFSITTNGGANSSTSSTPVTLSGNGWVDVRGIRLAGSSSPLPTTSRGSRWRSTPRDRRVILWRKSARSGSARARLRVPT